MTFQPGQSGNPKGRPRGIVDKRAELRGLLEEHAKDIINKLVERAKQGEPTALRLCLERLIPHARAGSDINLELPDGRFDSSDNMLKILNDVTSAVADGRIEVNQAMQFTVFLKKQEYLIKEVERKKRAEFEAEERKQYWAARLGSTSTVDS